MLLTVIHSTTYPKLKFKKNEKKKMKKWNSTGLELRSLFVHNYPYFYQSMTIAAQALANICVIRITIIFPVGQYDRDKLSMIWRLRWKQICNTEAIK